MADRILIFCNVPCDSRIVTVNSPSGSTLQCDTWLWDDMPLNSPKRPPYCNSTPGFDFDHITAVDMSFCNSLRHFIQIGPPSAEKNDVMSIFKMADLSHLDFRNPIMGSFKSPGTTSYRSSIETTIICSIFLHFGDRQTNRQTNEQMDTTDALSRSRCRKRRLNNIQRHFMSSMFSDDVHQISSYRAKRLYLGFL